MKIDITKMNETELYALNKQIVARLKLLHTIKQSTALANFSVSDTVSFKDKNGRKVVGKVISLGRKNAKVDVTTVDGVKSFPMRYTVSPSLLSKE